MAGRSERRFGKLTPSPATWHPTGREGEHEGTNHIEFELLDEQGEEIPLTLENVVYIKRNGVELPVVDDGGTTLWFNEENPAGEYTFEIKTVDGTVYVAILEWPLKE